MEGITWALAHFDLNLKFEDLDPNLIPHFKEYLLDGKPYACCASSHSSIDAVWELVGRHKWIPSGMEKVFVKTAKGVKG